MADFSNQNGATNHIELDTATGYNLDVRPHRNGTLHYGQYRPFTQRLPVCNGRRALNQDVPTQVRNGPRSALEASQRARGGKKEENVPMLTEGAQGLMARANERKFGRDFL